MDTGHDISSSVLLSSVLQFILVLLASLFMFVALTSFSNRPISLFFDNCNNNFGIEPELVLLVIVYSQISISISVLTNFSNLPSDIQLACICQCVCELTGLIEWLEVVSTYTLSISFMMFLQYSLARNLRCLCNSAFMTISFLPLSLVC